MDLLSKFSPDQFLDSAPSEFLEVLSLLHKCDLELMIVGGASRDYFSRGVFPRDIDAEIRPSSAIAAGDMKAWQEHLDRFLSLMKSRSHELFAAGVGVYKCDLGEYDLEFSTPRRETFRNGEWGHSNFDVHFDPFLKSSEAFIRRDFTINAIGILLSSKGVSVEDPFCGIADLGAKILRPVSNQFHRDPVRALRAIRFHLTLGYDKSSELERELTLANFSELTAHYIALESKKAGIFKFLHTFSKWASTFQWECPKALNTLMSLKLEDVTNSEHSEPFELYMILAAIGAVEEQLISFATLYGFKQNEVKLALRLMDDFLKGQLNLKPREIEKLASFKSKWKGPIVNTELARFTQLLP